MKKLFAAVCLFSVLMLPNLYSQMPAEWPVEYIGTWQVEESDGSPRFMVLYEDHSAQTTFNPKAQGQWQYDPDQEEVRINWNDGWADILVKEGNKFKNAGYSPGSGPDDNPANVGKAKKVKLNPFEYVGVWKITDLEGRESKITLNDNSTAQSNKKDLANGKWFIDGDRIHITWASGQNDFILKNENQYKLITYVPGVSVDATLGITADAERVEAFLRSDMRATEINEEKS